MSGVFERFGKKCRKEGVAKGFAKGLAQGRDENRKEKLAMIKAFMRNCGLTKERAMEILEIPLKDREQLMSQL